MIAIALIILAAAAAAIAFAMRKAQPALLAGRQVRQSLRWRRAHVDGPIDVFLCIADHFEPAWGNATDAVADARVAAWVRDYPRVLGAFRDSDGRSPRHTFFYPIDQYEPRHVDALAALCHEGHGEVEIHLHHDDDTAENLERTLQRFAHLFSDRHGLLGRRADGQIAYGFVHGNWALDNSRPDGRWCGVCNELEILRRTGCYADFTLPSAPDASQTRTINSIYYAIGAAGQCKSHDRGIAVGAAPPPPGGLMLIQGPLRLWWPQRSWKPRIENGCIQRGQAPNMARLEQWLRANVHVPSRPEWKFVKLHTHGAPEANQRVLLGEPMMKFHAALASRAARDRNFRFHYVTAREMYNLAKAAEAGWVGSAMAALDWAVSAHPRPTRLDSIVPEKPESPITPWLFHR